MMPSNQHIQPSTINPPVNSANPHEILKQVQDDEWISAGKVSS